MIATVLINRMLAVPVLFVVLTLHSCRETDIYYSSIEGPWRCEEYNPFSGNSIYMVDVDRSNSDTTVYLFSNFHNQDVNEFIYAKLQGLSLSIPDQVIGTMRVKSGSGTVSDDYRRIDLVYTVSDNQSEGTVEARYLRPE
jgi:hypothetical protein